MNSQLLTPENLAQRWLVHVNTLRYWRWNGTGPRFLKIGRRVLYRFEDIEQFEKNHLRQNTSQNHPISTVNG